MGDGRLGQHRQRVVVFRKVLDGFLGHGRDLSRRACLLQRVKVKAIGVGQVFAFGVLLLEGGQQVHCGFGLCPDGGGIKRVLRVHLDVAGIVYMIVPSCFFIIAGGSGRRDRFARQRARLRRQDLHLDGVFPRCGIFEFLICGHPDRRRGDDQRREENRQLAMANMGTSFDRCNSIIDRRGE